MTHIKFLGHAAVGLYANDGTSMIIDPYKHGLFDGRFGYSPIEEVFDCALSTHAHLDHCSIDALAGSPVNGALPPFEVTQTSLDHDEYDGQRRGGSVNALRIQWDDHTLVHLSDVGQSPSAPHIHDLMKPDVLLVPVGGFYTIGPAQALEWIEALNPKVTIPIHYKTEVIALPLADIHVFLAHCGTHARLSRSVFDLDDPLEAPIITLEAELG